jgi:hypothetical protein
VHPFGGMLLLPLNGNVALQKVLLNEYEETITTCCSSRNRIF